MMHLTYEPNGDEVLTVLNVENPSVATDLLFKINRQYVGRSARSVKIALNGTHDAVQFEFYDRDDEIVYIHSFNNGRAT